MRLASALFLVLLVSATCFADAAPEKEEAAALPANALVFRALVDPGKKTDVTEKDVLAAIKALAGVKTATVTASGKVYECLLVPTDAKVKQSAISKALKDGGWVVKDIEERQTDHEGLLKPRAIKLDKLLRLTRAQFYVAGRRWIEKITETAKEKETLKYRRMTVKSVNAEDAEVVVEDFDGEWKNRSERTETVSLKVVKLVDRFNLTKDALETPLGRFPCEKLEQLEQQGMKVKVNGKTSDPIKRGYAYWRLMECQLIVKRLSTQTTEDEVQGNRSTLTEVVEVSE